MDLSLLEVLAAMGVVAMGALVQGTIGFGLAVVAAPFLYRINPALVPGPLIIAGLVLGTLSARRYREHIDLPSLRFAILGRIPGSVLGGGLLLLTSSEQMGLILGTSVLLAVAASMTSRKLQATSSTLFAAGIVSGIMGTASSIGGPPMALVMQNESGDRIRANLSAFFVFGCLISLVVLAAGGFLDQQSCIYGAAMVPAVFSGSWVAGRLVRFVNQQTIRKALLFLCSISGAVAIYSAIPG